MAGSLPTNYLDPIVWGTSTGGAAGSAETTATIGTAKLDVRVPPDDYHISNLQLARFEQLFLAISASFKGGTRLQVLTQSSNPFAAGEKGYYADATATPNARFYDGTNNNHVAAAPLTTKGDLIIFNGTNFARLAVGTNTHVLTADSAQATGIKWAAGGGGGGATGLQSAYAGGSVAADQIILLDGGAGGPIIISDPLSIGGTLFSIQDSASATVIGVSATATTVGANMGLSCAAGTSAIDFSLGTGVFKTTTGTNTIGGTVSLAANKNVACAAGTTAIDWSLGTGVFKTTTGTNTLSGTVSLAANKNIACAAGTTAVDWSLGTGTFNTTTGTNTINGTVSLAANKNVACAAGTTAIDWSLGTGVFKTTTGAHTFGSASWAVPANTVITGASSATNTTGVTLTSNVTTGATSIGLLIASTTDLSTAGAKLVSITNNAGTEQLSFRKGGKIYGIGGASASLTLDDGNGSIFTYGSSAVGVGSDITGVSFRVGATFIAGVDANKLYPNTTNATTCGGSSNVWSVTWSTLYGTVVGSNIASGATIAPIKGITHITGTSAVDTITVPSSLVGTVTLIPDGAFTWTTAGNIAVAGTAVVNRALTMTYDSGTTKWYPSYT